MGKECSRDLVDPGVPGEASVRRALPPHAWIDAAILLILAATAAFLCFQGARQVDPVLRRQSTFDSWFEADTPRIYSNMTDREGDHYRTKVHPLFSLIGYGTVRAARGVLRLSALDAVHATMSAVAALWMAALYLLLRLIGCRRLDATIFSILAATSASAMFWFIVPETYPWGSLSILLALGIAALARHVRVSEAWHVAASALTLSFTVTNWMAGIFSAFASRPWRRALQISANAFCIVVILWGAQKLLFPSAGFFIGDREESKYMLHSGAGGPAKILRSFAFHSMVMPEIRETDRYRRPYWPIMYTQDSRAGSATSWGRAGIWLWSALLLLGIWGLTRLAGNRRPFRRTLLLTLAGQLGLHLVYGEETFLYSLHFAPLLITIAALGALTPCRWISIGLASALAACAAANNFAQLQEAHRFFQRHGKPVDFVERAMKARPGDPWSRSAGHAVLAPPGSLEVHKAYHEPGGSFSPAVGTFGVSIWVTDEKGNLVAASDTLPIQEITQRFVWDGEGLLPGISTETPFYRALWSWKGPGKTELRLSVPEGRGGKTWLAIRSPGPAGGPVRSLSWDGRALIINESWRLVVSPPPAAVCLGEEGSPGWKAEPPSGARWRGESGWGYARLELRRGAEIEPGAESRGGAKIERGAVAIASLEGPVPPPDVDWALSSCRIPVEMDLPDERFKACAEAQAAHILMGFVGGESRPFDPMDAAVPSQREEACIAVALASAGRVDAARRLAAHLAAHDFSGALGAEADAPGISLWALEEVAARVGRSDFDLELWPHFRRKAELIIKMLDASLRICGPVPHPFPSRHEGNQDLLVTAEPSEDGLIVGRAGLEWPVLYVNSVSYRGLLDAAELARRIGRTDEAERWSARALEIARSWEKALASRGFERRNSAAGLWPTGAACSARDMFLKSLETGWTRWEDSRSSAERPPPQSSLDIAQAHQWLFFDRADRAGAVLAWFWEHQASPGLFTWWEDESSAASYHGWEGVRGWVNPSAPQPHYGIAAQVLLLQLDMLACLSPAEKEPTLVVGAGVPKGWLEKPLSVRGVSTRLARVDWTWKDGKLHVVVRGQKLPVRAGSAFGGSTPLSVEFLPPD